MTRSAARFALSLAVVGAALVACYPALDELHPFPCAIDARGETSCPNGYICGVGIGCLTSDCGQCNAAEKCSYVALAHGARALACVAKGKAALQAPCTVQAPGLDTCAAGYCAGDKLGNTALACRQACVSGKGDCGDTMRCIEQSELGTTVTLCMPPGSRRVGEECTLDAVGQSSCAQGFCTHSRYTGRDSFTCHDPCDNDSTCTATQHCVPEFGADKTSAATAPKVCEERGSIAIGATCTSDATGVDNCATGVCTAAGSTSNKLTCVAYCTASTQCASTQSCVLSAGNRGICVASCASNRACASGTCSPARNFEDKSSSWSACTSSSVGSDAVWATCTLESCKAGSDCVARGNTRYCFATCAGDGECMAPLRCNKGADALRGYCGCATDADCPGGDRCTASDPGDTDKRCAPKRQFAEACLENAMCVPGTTCLGAGATYSCMKTCATGGTCDAGFTCKSYGSFSACACTTNSACPAGTHCDKDICTAD